ncbi:MAG: hypothetical protein U5L00_18875 [Desulfovermiculus sp.]|nr:hypothetical protein [Desulfovermiculus sp.]
MSLVKLRNDYRRIGSVLIGMPGDQYADVDNIYAVGEKAPSAGRDAAPNWQWPVPPGRKS